MIIKKQQLSNYEKNLIQDLSNKSRLSFEMVALLYSRGIKTLDQINGFIYPSKKSFYSPFLLKDIDKAVKRISQAKEENQTVVIFGDYDADGILATSVLYKALQVYGIQAITVVPERDNGYGLTEEVIDCVISEYLPDLIITVDCGISCFKEVEYIQDLGVDIIVTDHHEIPEILPNCITVNCKLQGQEYPFSGLCGCGVAYKLASALIGEKADEYLDLVAIATIADSMPLIEENRAIVKEGLNLIKNSKCQKAVEILVKESQLKEVTAGSIAFSISPKINAAGRMNDAFTALRFFTTNDEQEMSVLVKSLIEYNAKRQDGCNELHLKAKEKIAKQGCPEKVIVLYDENWQQGLLGIISARIAEEYNLPCVILSKSGDSYHGSARSIEGINIYDALCYAKEYLEEFGGHAQAAGVKIKEENIALFTEKLKEFVSKNINKQIFNKKIIVEDIDIDDLTIKFAKELSLLEPFGIANEKPLFSTCVEDIIIRKMKADSPHLIICLDKFDLLYFYGESKLDLLTCSSKKNIVFELGVSTYNQKESLTGYVKAVEEEFAVTDELSINCALKVCNDILSTEINGDFTQFSQDTLSSIDPFGYGTLICVNNQKNLDKFSLNQFTITANSVVNLKSKTVVKVGGVTDEEAFLYKRVIYLDTPFILPKIRGVNNVVNTSLQSYEPCLTREVVVDVYKKVVKLYNEGRVLLNDKIYKKIECNYTLEQIVFAIETLKELGIIKRKGELLVVDNSVKNDLSNSTIFKRFSI